MKKILWVDDEVEFLKPHLLFLKDKGYTVNSASNGADAIALIQEEPYDLILLDQMMLGMDGMATLTEIKRIDPNLPVIMVTKSEEEPLMDEAFGKGIDDFLVKPIHPRQLTSLLKRVLEKRGIMEKRMGQNYAEVYQEINEKKASSPGWKEWLLIYQRLVEWDLLIDQLQEEELLEAHNDLKALCNTDFCRYVEGKYGDWVARGQKGKSRILSSEVGNQEDIPLLSPEIVEAFLFPYLKNGEKILFLILDCLRLDQYLAIDPLLKEYFEVKKEYYYSILPTATPYSRNAIFSGLFPDQISKMYPQYWETGSEVSQNRYEDTLLKLQLKRKGIAVSPDPRYFKIYDLEHSQQLRERFNSLVNTPFITVVANFVDLLTHHRGDSKLLQEVTPDEGAFRSLTHSWFLHSPLFSILQYCSRQKRTVVLTTDHGAIRCGRATPIYGGRTISSNLRYKYGSALRCDDKHALVIKDPESLQLPLEGQDTRYCIAKEDYYFVYPTHFQRYEKQYKGTFQHGGISMEEMILPLSILTPT
jgi:CheY-like chemotaxis protein